MPGASWAGDGRTCGNAACLPFAKNFLVCNVKSSRGPGRVWLGARGRGWQSERAWPRPHGGVLVSPLSSASGAVALAGSWLSPAGQGTRLSVYHPLPAPEQTLPDGHLTQTHRPKEERTDRPASRRGPPGSRALSCSLGSRASSPPERGAPHAAGLASPLAGFLLVSTHFLSRSTPPSALSKADLKG